MMPLLIATLEGDVEEIDVGNLDQVYPLGRSFLRRTASRAGKAVVRSVNPISQVANVSRMASRVTRATARPLMQLSRGNVRGAFVDLGRAATTTVSAPLTLAVGAVNKDAGKSLERVIARNDPNALINRKIFEAVKAAVRPIVRKFAGEDLDGFGEEPAQIPTTKRAALRAARGKILAAASTAGAAAGTSVAGPYGAPVGAALAPAAVDAVIEEIGKEPATRPAPAAGAAGALPKSSGLPVPLLLGAAGVAAFLLLKKKG